MAIAGYPTSSGLPRQSGTTEPFAGLPGTPEARARHPAERVIEGEVLGRAGHNGFFSTEEVVRLRGSAQSHSGLPGHRMAAAYLTVQSEGAASASRQTVDVYV